MIIAQFRQRNATAKHHLLWRQINSHLTVNHGFEVVSLSKPAEFIAELLMTDGMPKSANEVSLSEMDREEFVQKVMQICRESLCKSFWVFKVRNMLLRHISQGEPVLVPDVYNAVEAMALRNMGARFVGCSGDAVVNDFYFQESDFVIEDTTNLSGFLDVMINRIALETTVCG